MGLWFLSCDWRIVVVTSVIYGKCVSDPAFRPFRVKAGTPSARGTLASRVPRLSNTDGRQEEIGHTG